MPDAGRVIAGTARSIRLEAPGPGTRPLADRVKQTLFAILEPDLRGARFLDLFAGSGAAGIEALSRGAAEAIFVEHDRTAVQIIHANLDRTDLAATERATVVRADAFGWLRGPERGAEPPIDIAVVDPPYDDTEVADNSARGACHRCSPDAPRRRQALLAGRPTATVGLLASERQRRFGETALTFYRARWRTHERRGLPRLVRPDHERPPRHRRAGRGGLRHGDRRGARQPEEGTVARRSRSASRSSRPPSPPTTSRTSASTSTRSTA